jgi:hypothetical protein
MVLGALVALSIMGALVCLALGDFVGAFVGVIEGASEGAEGASVWVSEGASEGKFLVTHHFGVSLLCSL